MHRRQFLGAAIMSYVPALLRWRTSKPKQTDPLKACTDDSTQLCKERKEMDSQVCQLYREGLIDRETYLQALGMGRV